MHSGIHSRWLTGTAIAAVFVLAGAGAAAHDTGIAETHQKATTQAQPGQDASRVPLWSNLGDLSFKVTTVDPR